MRETILLTGMVLAVIPIGEYDKRITIFTKERGKISAFAKGARRPNSKLLAAASPFTFGEFEVLEGKSSYTIFRITVTNYFSSLREQLEEVYYGFYFLEITDYYTRENLVDLHMLKLLYQSLRALEKPTLPNRLVRVIFELKAMVISGEYPNVFTCLHCGNETAPFWFQYKTAAMVCETCHQFDRTVPVNPAALYAMQYIVTATIEQLYTFVVTKEVLFILEEIMTGCRAYYMEKEWKSLRVLEEQISFTHFCQE
jgi:DNA repair protein RecO (recombination protein O)